MIRSARLLILVLLLVAIPSALRADDPGVLIVAGIVTDPDGAAVEGARVEVFRNYSRKATCELRTGPGGEYVLEFPNVPTDARILVHPPEGSPWWRAARGVFRNGPTTPPVTAMDFQLIRPWELTLRVLNERAEPIAGAAVTPDYEHHVTTDSDGMVTIPGNLMDDYPRATIEHPDYERLFWIPNRIWQLVQPVSCNLDAVLKDPFHLKLRVRWPDGRPVQRFRYAIELHPLMRCGNEPVWPLDLEWQSVQDLAGEARVRRERMSTLYTIRVAAEDGTGAWAPHLAKAHRKEEWSMTGEDKPEEVELVLTEALPIAGRVVLADGITPAAGARVAATGPGPKESKEKEPDGFTPEFAWTDANGNFSFAGISEEANLEMTASLEGYGTSPPVRWDPAAAGGGTSDCRLILGDAVPPVAATAPLPSP